MLLPTEDQIMLRDLAGEVLHAQADPARLRVSMDTPSGHDSDLWKQLSELGWPTLPLPEDLGGLGSGLSELACVVEQCGAALMPSALTSTVTVAWLLVRHASPAQRAAWLPGLSSGETTLTWSLADVETGSPLQAAETGAEFRLTGVRPHVPDVAAASYIVVDALGPAGPVLALVPTGTSGLARRAERTIDLTRRYATMSFDGVPVSADMVIGAEKARAELLQAGVVLQCAESVGAAARAFDMTAAYVRQRSQFGRTIGSFQAVKHRIADMYIELEGARVAIRDAAEAVQNARPDAAFAVHAAKSWTARAAGAITSEAIQLHGGIGFTWEHDLHLLQRRTKANELLLGTPVWHEEQLAGVLAADV